jgi:hypothetical protein
LVNATTNKLWWWRGERQPTVLAQPCIYMCYLPGRELPDSRFVMHSGKFPSESYCIGKSPSHTPTDNGHLDHEILFSHYLCIVKPAHHGPISGQSISRIALQHLVQHPSPSREVRTVPTNGIGTTLTVSWRKIRLKTEQSTEEPKD